MIPWLVLWSGKVWFSGHWKPWRCFALINSSNLLNFSLATGPLGHVEAAHGVGGPDPLPFLVLLSAVPLCTCWRGTVRKPLEGDGPSFPLRASWSKHCHVTSAHTSWPVPIPVAPASRLGNIVLRSVAVCYIKLSLLGRNGRANFNGSMSGLFHSQGQFPRGDGEPCLKEE